MSLQWSTQVKVIEDEHGEIHAVSIPDYTFLELSEDYEDKIKKENRQVNTALLVVCVTFWILVLACFAWLVGVVAPWAWSNLVWLWNSGGDQPWDGPARWGVVTGIACAVWFCFVGFVEWWRKERR